MPLLILILFYIAVAACEIAFPQQCAELFEKLISDERRVRMLGIGALFIALLFFLAVPSRIKWFLRLLSCIYLFSGAWFIAHPKSFLSLCKKGYLDLEAEERRKIFYVDCGLRTLLALILVFSI